MKLPRDVNGGKLVRALRRFGYETARSTGSPFILTTQAGGEYHVTVPAHKPVKPGTLGAILKSVAAHHTGETVESVVRKLKL